VVCFFQALQTTKNDRLHYKIFASSRGATILLDVRQDGILRPIGNRLVVDFLENFGRPINNPPRVNQPHMIRTNFAAKPRCATNLTSLTTLYPRNGHRRLAGLPFDHFHTQKAMFGNSLVSLSRHPQQDLHRRLSHFVLRLMNRGKRRMHDA